MTMIDADDRMQQVERMTIAFLRIADGTAASGRATPADVALALFAAACGKMTETFGEANAAAHLELMAAHCREMHEPMPDGDEAPSDADESWERPVLPH
jgi:hypothetical protein